MYCGCGGYSCTFGASFFVSGFYIAAHCHSRWPQLPLCNNKSWFMLPSAWRHLVRMQYAWQRAQCNIQQQKLDRSYRQLLCVTVSTVAVLDHIGPAVPVLRHEDQNNKNDRSATIRVGTHAPSNQLHMVECCANQWPLDLPANQKQLLTLSVVRLTNRFTPTGCSITH